MRDLPDATFPPGIAVVESLVLDMLWLNEARPVDAVAPVEDRPLSLPPIGGRR